MILTFCCKDTEALYGGSCHDRFRAFQAQAERKLQMLDSADTIDDLRSPPGNHLEKLSGDRLGRWSIRINNQWRICFRFENGNAYDVEIVDYH